VSYERQIERIVDKDGMRKLIDSLRDDQSAILIAQCEDSEESVTYHILGNIPFWKGVGMIETAKLELFEQHYHGELYEDDTNES
jgi:hypothetical protein